MKTEPRASRVPAPRTVLAVFASYLAAGAGAMLYERWPDYAGHAHVPFSGFPEFLVWSPVAPYFVLTGLFTQPRSGFGGALVFLAVFGALLWRVLRKPAPAARP